MVRYWQFQCFYPTYLGNPEHLQFSFGAGRSHQDCPTLSIYRWSPLGWPRIAHSVVKWLIQAEAVITQFPDKWSEVCCELSGFRRCWLKGVMLKERGPLSPEGCTLVGQANWANTLQLRSDQTSTSSWPPSSEGNVWIYILSEILFFFY